VGHAAHHGGEVARAVAREDDAEIATALLAGKPYQAIVRYLAEVAASLVVVGKVGVHADCDLDIGGTTENLLHRAPCHVWIGTATHTPPLDAVARETIVWSSEAEQRIARVPEAVRNMVRMVILRYAQEQGHTVITSALVEEATARFCPGHRQAEPARAQQWADDASAVLDTFSDAAVAADMRLRAEKHARREGAAEVGLEHVRPFLEVAAGPRWSAAALARLHRVPEMARAAAQRRAEAHAGNAGVAEVTIESVEAALAESRRLMEQVMRSGGHGPPGGE
jgi:hypothetical protein